MILADLHAIAKRENLPGSRQILDVGCGDGLFFNRLAAFGDVQGVEPDQQLIDPDAEHASRIHIGQLDDHYQPSAPLNWILMLDVLEHIEDPRQTLARARSLLAPGGRLIVTVPAFKLLWTKHDDMNQHFTRYRRGELVTLVQESGFDVDLSRYFFHWLFPAKLLVRAKEAIVSSPAQPARIPLAPINHFLRLISQFENQLWSWLRVPWGSSLLLHATRSSDSGAEEQS